jgi:hypothetical protein
MAAPGKTADPVARIEALLGPRLREPGARARRDAILAETPELTPAEVAFLEALDAVIDGLVSRGRPRTGAASRPRETSVVRAPPPVPPSEAATPGNPGSTTREAERPRVSAPEPTKVTPSSGLAAPGPATPPSPEAVAFASSETIIAARPDVRPGAVVGQGTRIGGAGGSDTPGPGDGAPPQPGLSSGSAPGSSGSGPSQALLEPIPGTAPATYLLYDDIVQLSALNDWDAAFISIERLLVLARVEDHVGDFVRSNEAHLLGLYEPALKSFSRVPKRREQQAAHGMHRVFLNNAKVAEVLALVDRKLAIRKMFDSSKLSRLEVCATLVVLQRAGVLEI